MIALFFKSEKCVIFQQIIDRVVALIVIIGTPATSIYCIIKYESMDFESSIEIFFIFYVALAIINTIFLLVWTLPQLTRLSPLQICKLIPCKGDKAVHDEPKKE